MSDVDQAEPLAAFEKARYQYCKELFERERARKQSLENKAQMILSLVTLILGVIFFKLEFFKQLNDLLENNCVARSVLVSMYLTLSILGVCLWVALYSVLRAIRLQVYKEEHPKNFITSVFAPQSDYLPEETQTSFYKATAMSYAIALEQNSNVNDKKASWVRYSWYSLISAAVLLAVFIALYAYVSLM